MMATIKEQIARHTRAEATTQHSQEPMIRWLLHLSALTIGTMLMGRFTGVSLPRSVADRNLAGMEKMTLPQMLARLNPHHSDNEDRRTRPLARPETPSSSLG
jgi:hypothetical protein